MAAQLGDATARHHRRSALAIAFVFKDHGGLGVLFGLAIFQALLVMSTSIPVLKKIRTQGLDVSGHGIEGLS